MEWLPSFLVAACVSACGGSGGGGDSTPPPTNTPTSVDIKIIAINDFLGNLSPPQQAVAVLNGDFINYVPAGGASYLATAIAGLRAQNPNNALVSAGNLWGASPLNSGLFLDEPTIAFANAVGMDFAGLGNHEFNRGQNELLRMQSGGCTKFTALQPCVIDTAFSGAQFKFLAANVFKADGSTLVAATGVKTFGSVKVGFIGMPRKAAADVVVASAVAGLRFADEAQTANAQAAQLKAQGVDVIVLLLNEGGAISGNYTDKSCSGLQGDFLPILENLNPTIDVVVTGHSYTPYVCDYAQVNPAKPFLVTSAGQNGTMLTDINLHFDIATKKLTRKSADTLIIQGEAYGTVGLSSLVPTFTKSPAIDALIASYAPATTQLAGRIVGSLSKSILRAYAPSGENYLGNMIADAELAATAASDKGGAQIAFMNPGGVRANLVSPSGGGSITYGQLFAVLPFGNSLVVKGMTGKQIRAVLEQQFNSGANTPDAPRVLLPSAGFSYNYNLSKAAGARISNMQLNGVPIADNTTYRVPMNSFLSAGGDFFTVLTQGINPLVATQEIDAVEAYIKAQSPLGPPNLDRITVDN